MISGHPAPSRSIAILQGAAVLCWLTCGTSASLASVDPASVCDQVASAAAQSQGVPLSVMMAIALNETGRKSNGQFRPWPWTVNMEGAGHWFDSRDEALTYSLKEHERGARSFDVGCFQINYKWHGQNFASIEDMFDPMTNAQYAARYLRSLYLEQGSWEAAAGAYHSRTPELANRYAERFSRFRSNLLDQAGEEIPVIPDIVLAANGGDGSLSARVNRFPLLQPGGGSALGSLVPVSNASGTMLFGARQPGTEP